MKETERFMSAPTLLDQPYELAADVVRRFGEEGFVKLRGVLDADTIAHFEPEITKSLLDRNTQHTPVEERKSTYQRAFLQVENLWQSNAAVKELVFAPRLARIATELLGTSGVRLFHDQALYKEPGGGITPWHADQYYWPFSSDRVCTVWIPLQETPMEMGPLSFSVGSHHFEFGRDMEISDASEAALQRALSEQGFRHVNEPYELGEVSFHLGWTFHRAQPNRSDQPRRVMTIIYMDKDIVVSQPANDAQRGDLANALSGAAPGSVPNGPLNPILYEQTKENHVYA